MIPSHPSRRPWMAAALATVLTVAGCTGGSTTSGPAPGGPPSKSPPPSSSPPAGAPARPIDPPSGGVMILVPAGEFLMGSDAAVDSAPVHQVAVSSFYIDKHEVTQALYERITGKNPSRRVGPDKPVERVRWREAIAFANLRSAADGLRPCYDVKTGACDFSADGYRLPTEAEWEYACRAGTSQAYYFGDSDRDLTNHAWFKKNAAMSTHPVGQRTPNAFGLADTSGNVWEWCHDWYQVDYYASSPAQDPQGPPQGEKKVLRGGGFKSAAESCTSFARHCDDPGFTDACVATDDYGFRCVRRVP